MSVTVHYDQLDAAVSAMSSLSSSLTTQLNHAASGAPIDLPSLSASTVTQISTWLDNEKPMLEQLSTIAKLLDDGNSGQATFNVGPLPSDVENLLGETFASQAGSVSPNFREEFEEYTELFSQYTDDPQVMGAFYEAIEPEGLLGLMSQIAQNDMVGEDAFAPLEVRQQLIDSLQTGLETASEHDDGFMDTNFANGLVDAATSDPELWHETGRIDYNPIGALTVLLQDGEFSDTFISVVASRLDGFERSEGNTSDYWWYGNSTNHNFDQFLPFHVNTSDGPDPVAAAMSALGNSPDAALGFFSGGGSNPELAAERAEYYIKNRDWHSDGMDGLTDALDAGSTQATGIDDPTSPEAHDAAFLASQTVELISERDDLEQLTELFANTEVYGNESSENLAHIMTTYMPAVDGALDPSNASDVSGPGVFTTAPNGTGGESTVAMPLFDRNSLSAFSDLAMASDDGFAEVRAGSNAYREAYLGAAVNTYANDPSNSTYEAALNDALTADARREGFFVRQIEEQNIADGAAADARTEAWIEFGGDIVDLVPIPGVDKLEGLASDVINAGIDRAKGEGTDAITDALTHAEDDAQASAEDAADATLNQQSYAVAALLAERGLAGDPNLEVPSWSEFQGLSDAEQRDVWTSLNSPQNGVGVHFNSEDYAQTFNSELTTYFYDD